MGLAAICDGGCGATTEKVADFIKLGQVKPGYYCRECAESVRAYFAERDKLHEKVAAVWRRGLKRFEEKWRKEHKGGTLPDRPDAGS